MKKIVVIGTLLALMLGGGTANAQVSESPEWAMKIKAEGLGRS